MNERLSSCWSLTNRCPTIDLTIQSINVKFFMYRLHMDDTI